MAERLPEASTKLRMVLDYVPCEACLAEPVQDQDLLCGVCGRLDRQVGVRVAVRRTVLLERPDLPAPVVIEPPAPAAPAPPVVPALDVVLVQAGESPPPPREGVPQVVLEPWVAPPAPVEAPPAEPEFEGIYTWIPPPPAPAPPVAPVVADVPEDDYVFRPPTAEEPEPVEAPPLVEEAWMPTEEVPVEPREPARNPWAPQEEAREPQPEPQPEPAEAPLQETVMDEDVMETSVVEDEPPAASSDLMRLRGMDADALAGLARANVKEVQHLAGHDPVELSPRAGVPKDRLAPWIQVADLIHEAGVPFDAAAALVSAGVAGPRGLREMEADTIVERVHAFAGVTLAGVDVRRWKRRV